MKIRLLLVLLMALSIQIVAACPLCEKQQPKITLGLTHGTGPQSNWDWVIIFFITGITLFTFVFSLKNLIRPGEKNTDHIKQSILSN
jgi:hypothetical protein